MRHLFFANTPAHVHLYKHAVRRLRDRGADALVLARDYGCTLDLLEHYGILHRVYGHADTSKYSLFRRLPGHFARIARDARAYDPDLIFGMGTYSAVAGVVTRAPVVLLLDSETTTLDHRLSRPVASAILTPDSFRKNLGERHFVFEGFKESAYLHPSVFEHDPTVRERLGVAADERFAIVRFNAFGSHHDVGREGFSRSERRRLVRALAEEVTVLVSDEGGDLDLAGLPARPFDLHPAELHDAIAEASLLVADTQTMVTEAALLGTPAVRSNSFVGDDDMGNFIALEEAGLVVNEREFDGVLATVRRLLADDDLAERWRRRRDDLLADQVNLTELVLSVAANPDDVDGVEGLRRFGTAPAPAPARETMRAQESP